MLQRTRTRSYLADRRNGLLRKLGWERQQRLALAGSRNNGCGLRDGNRQLLLGGRNSNGRGGRRQDTWNIPAEKHQQEASRTQVVEPESRKTFEKSRTYDSFKVLKRLF
jgi:hypothetical protein